MEMGEIVEKIFGKKNTISGKEVTFMKKLKGRLFHTSSHLILVIRLCCM